MTLFDKKSYTDIELEEFKQLILDKIDLNNTHIADLKHSLEKMENQNIGYSESALESENQLTKINLKRIRKINNLLIDALKRIANKTYGICVKSGLLIPKERLLSVPHTTHRIEYKETDNINSSLSNDSIIDLKSNSKYESDFGFSSLYNNNIFLRKGKFGYFIQIGEDGEKINLNNRVTAFNLKEAEILFSTKPKKDTLIGSIDNNDIILKYGRYGYYISYNKRTISVPKRIDHNNIDLNTALQIINKNLKKPENRTQSSNQNKNNLEIEKLIKENKFIEASRLHKASSPKNWSNNRINEEFELLCELTLTRSN